jgi:hypothetical protein
LPIGSISTGASGRRAHRVQPAGRTCVASPLPSTCYAVGLACLLVGLVG